MDTQRYKELKAKLNLAFPEAGPEIDTSKVKSLGDISEKGEGRRNQVDE